MSGNAGLGGGSQRARPLWRAKKCNQSPACPKCSSSQFPPSPELLYAASSFPSCLLRHSFHGPSGKSYLKQSERLLSDDSWLQASTNAALPCCLPFTGSWQAAGLIASLGTLKRCSRMYMHACTACTLLLLTHCGA